MGRRTIGPLIALLAAAPLAAAAIRVTAVRGDVTVRHGAQKEWIRLADGDTLKPDDSIRLKEHASAVVVDNDGKRFRIPEKVILDISDLRTISREDLSLLLAMEAIESVPAKPGPQEFPPAKTTLVHGANRMPDSSAGTPDSSDGAARLRGVRVLYDYDFYATCVLRARATFELLPGLLNDAESRLRVAESFEKMQMTGEAVAEYRSIAALRLSPEQKQLVAERIRLLKPERGE